MGLAADAISDLIAPPPRPDVSAPRNDDDGPSFSDHLLASQSDDIKRAPPDHSNANTANDASDKRETPRPEHERPADRAKSADRPAKTPDTKTNTQSDDQAAQAAAVAAVSTQTRSPAPAPAQAPSPLMQVLAHLAAQRQDAKGAAATDTDAHAQQQANAAAQPQLATAQTQAAGKTARLKHSLAGKLSTTNTNNAGATKAAQADPKAAAAVDAQTPAPGTTPAPEAAKSDAQPAADPAQTLAALMAPPQQQDATPAPKPRDLAIDAKAGASAKIPPETWTPRPAVNAAQNGDRPSLAKAVGAAAAQAAAKENFTLPGASAPEPSSAQNNAPASAALAAPSPAGQTSATADIAAARAVPVSAQVGREIIRRSATGSTRFEMRLDPPGLGRVDVRLEVSRDHRVTAVISADTPQALNELSRGARDLQQSLQQAGLDLADDGLSFDLSHQQNTFTQTNSFEQQQQRGPNGSPGNAAASAETETRTTARPLSIDSWRGSRVDVVA